MENIKFDVGGWNSSGDNAPRETHAMSYAVYQGEDIIALFRSSMDAEAFMELLEAKFNGKVKV